MRIETRSLAYAVGLGAASAWTICSILVAFASTATMTVTKDMFHLAGHQIEWRLTWRGFVVGLICWTLFSGLFAALCAGLYNRFRATALDPAGRG